MLIFYLLCSKLCLIIITIYVYSRQSKKTVLIWCIYKWHQNTLHVLLDYDYSIRAYQSLVAIFKKLFPIMLALCLMLSVTYYAQNYAGKISWSLVVVSPCLNC